MANQSPMISIPLKSTDEVDWTTPIRHLISQSYGESPDNYASECASLQRCRQDAVRGAGSDSTARDLLYKYFGQLELLELRFSEIRVTFPWKDAFTGKLTTQTSIAFEKASILFQIASVHSSLAASQSRSDPEGIKRAFHYFRTCAGMLTYINDNFLHAPSTDLSREVVKFLVALILAQATEVFLEKCTEEKKGSGLISKVAAQTAGMYTALTEQVKEFMGKGIFDRNWVTLIQIKAKYVSSLAQYHRSLADNALSKHGDALVRLTQAETLAKESQWLCSSFNPNSNASPTLPADAASALSDRIKSHLSLCTDVKTTAQRENDLIYNAVLPKPDSLPQIETTSVASVATPISIQEVYGAPEVQKVIGQDIFLRLIPLSVHESASVYSEEKAKLVRGEVESVELAESQARSAIEAMGVKEGIAKFKAILKESADDDDDVDVIPSEVRRWIDEIASFESRDPLTSLLSQLTQRKSNAESVLSSISSNLSQESHTTETLRVQYGVKYTQEPSASITRDIRRELKELQDHLGKAEGSDRQVEGLWEGVRADVGVLLGWGRESELEELFRRAMNDQGGQSASEHARSLLDLDEGINGDEEAKERAVIAELVSEIEERLGRSSKIARERGEILKDLKEKIQTDDVSHLLLLNRKNTSVEPTLFAAELEKFRPYQQRLGETVVQQETVLSEVGAFWKKLREVGGGKRFNRISGGGGRNGLARRWEEREKRKKEIVSRFGRARGVYMEVRDGIAKGLAFYNDLSQLVSALESTVKELVERRNREREALVRQLEVEKRLSGGAGLMGPSPTSQRDSGPPPPLPPPPPSSASGHDLSASLAGISLSNPSKPPPPISSYTYPYVSPPNHSQTQWRNTPTPPVSQSPHDQQQQPYFPQPPPSQSSTQPTYTNNSYPSYPSSSPTTQQNQQQQYQQYGNYTSPPPPPSAPPSTYAPPPPPPDPYASLGLFNLGNSPSTTTSPPPLPSSSRQQGQQSYGSGFPSQPPQQQGYSGQGSYGRYSSPPPPPPQQAYGGFQSPPPQAPQQQQQNYQQGYGGYNPSPPLQQQPPYQGYQGFPPPPPQPQPHQQQSYQGYQDPRGYSGNQGYGSGR
ncbi:BRO1-like domain-containing protein [Lentinula guzmanii]|uniref:BRO domain-containing protein 1 n=1 Tax=Lentinula guzmanii TaxID=2804957 RepID=A0AA38MYZ8_9AGAR|nr:BRO1-like domain-containing protein [Lentinula guzmanii]